MCDRTKNILDLSLKYFSEHSHGWVVIIFRVYSVTTNDNYFTIAGAQYPAAIMINYFT